MARLMYVMMRSCVPAWDACIACVIACDVLCDEMRILDDLCCDYMLCGII